MKKVFLLLFTAVLAISCSKSDSGSSETVKKLSLTKLDGTVITDGSVIAVTSSGDNDALVAFYVKNSSASAINIKAKCVSVTSSDGSDIQFCFGAQCYAGVSVGQTFPIDPTEIITIPANGQLGGESYHFQNFATNSADYVFEFYQYDSNNAVVGNKVTVTYRYTR